MFTARDVKNIAGLSYRQINDWDSRDALPHDRATEGGWRRFSPRDIFALMVIHEIRKKFGIPVNRLRWVQEFMLQDGANHYQAAARLMVIFGMGVWLITDCEETFIMDSEMELIDLTNHGYFGGDEEKAYIMVKLNPLVNRLLSCLKDPIHLPAHGKGYEILHAMREDFGVRNASEQRVLQIARDGDYRKIEIKLDNGEIRTIRATASRPKDVRLEDLLGEHEFQRIVVTKRDGEVVTIDQEVTERVADLEFDIRIEKEAPDDAN